MAKILITGPHSTGKSTLVAGLAKRLRKDGKPCVIVPDIARESPFPIGRGQSIATTLWLFHSQVAAELEAAQDERQLVLCDRGTLDIWAHLADVVERAQTTDRLIEALRPFARVWSRTYDLSFFSGVDDTLSVAQDGLREADDAYRARIEALIFEVLAEFEVPFHRLPLGQQAREEAMVREIELLTHPSDQ